MGGNAGAARVPFALSVRNMSWICSGVNDATSSASAAELIWGWPGVDDGGWNEGKSRLNDDSDESWNPRVGTAVGNGTGRAGVSRPVDVGTASGGSTSLPLFNTQIPIR